jgi:hypothetical protein
VSFEEKKQKDQKDLGRFGFLFSDAKRKKNRCRHMLRNSQKCKWEAKETKAISKVDKKRFRLLLYPQSYHSFLLPEDIFKILNLFPEVRSC